MADALRRSILAGIVFGLSISVVLGDTPAHPYTVKLGLENEDLERQIDAIPWTRLEGEDEPVKDVSQVNFFGRDLRCSEVHFLYKGLYHANFDNCTLDGSTFLETRFVGCTFRNANLRFCELDTFSHTLRFRNDFTGADITGSWFWGFPENSLKQTASYRKRSLIGVAFRGALCNVSFRDFQLCNVDFPSEPGTLEGCDFTGATLRQLIVSNLSSEQLYSTANYINKDLSGILLLGLGDESCREKWDFSDCNLSYFIRCDLRSACFDNAFFLRTKAGQVHYLSTAESELTVSSYYQAKQLADIGFDRCMLVEPQLQRTANWRRKDLRGMHLKNMNLDGWHFSGMNMGDADLCGSSLKAVDFTDADIARLRLQGCRHLTVSQLMQTKTYKRSSRQDILAYYWDVDFVDRTDSEKEFQDSLRRDASRR